MRAETFTDHGDGAISEALVSRPLDSQRALKGAALFVHGFAVAPACYSSLCDDLAERLGVAVVAPRVYSANAPVSDDSLMIAPWARRVRDKFPGVLILAGHSRGAQAVMLAASNLFATTCTLPRHHAVLLLDCVEGAPQMCNRKHVLLADVSGWSLSLDVPVLVIGAELGTKGFVPTAPPGYNYEAVWTHGLVRYVRSLATTEAAKSIPMWKVVAPNFGHMDYLNNLSECVGVARWSWMFAPDGSQGRALFRAFASITIQAFLETHVPALSRRADPHEWTVLVSKLRENDRLDVTCGTQDRPGIVGSVRAHVVSIGDDVPAGND